jgi:hypothetical protein
VQGFDVVHEDEHNATGSAIAVMRREVQHERPTGHLHEGGTPVAALLPVERAAR